MSSLILFLTLTLESHIDHDEKQLNDKSIEVNEHDEPSYIPHQVRRSTRSTKNIPPTRYGSITSHQVNVHDVPGKKVAFVYYL